MLRAVAPRIRLQGKHVLIAPTGDWLQRDCARTLKNRKTGPYRDGTIRHFFKLQICDHVMRPGSPAFKALVAHAPVVPDRRRSLEHLVCLVGRDARVREQLPERLVLCGVDVAGVAEDKALDGYTVCSIHVTFPNRCPDTQANGTDPTVVPERGTRQSSEWAMRQAAGMKVTPPGTGS